MEKGRVLVVGLMERGGRQMRGAITRRDRTRVCATRGTRGATLTLDVEGGRRERRA